MAFTAAKPQRSPSPGVPTTGAHRQNFLAVPRSRDSSSTPTPVPTSPTPLRSPTATLQPQQRMDIDTAHPMPASSAQAQNRSQTIQVVVRFRPAREQDPFEWYKAIEEQGAVQVTTPERALDFGFDRVFDSQATQADVYDSVRHVVKGLLDGFNGTLLAYGQTGSGKTHTMMGRPEFEMDTSLGNISGSSSPPVLPTPHTPRTGGIGVIPRAVDDLFAMVADFQDTIEFTFKVSYVEVYCEKVRDLLDTENGGDLKLRDDPQGGVAVTGATEVFVQSQAEILKVIEAGQLGRMTAATRMNEESSRSHALLLLTVTQKNTETLHIRRGKLTLVDLAGSERIAKTGALGLRLEEAKNINRSLTTLGMVISALADGKPHVPYRDAKLTRILAESLGGNSRTCLIVCCAPELSHSQESISTLRFGERAKKVKNHAVRNEELSAYELQVLLTRALAEIEQLKALLLTSAGGGGGGGGNGGGGVEGGVVAVGEASTIEMATAAAVAMADLFVAPSSSAVVPAVEEGDGISSSSPVLASVEGADGVTPLTNDDDPDLATEPSSSALGEAEGGEELAASVAQAQEEGRASLMSTGPISGKRAYKEKDNLLSPMEVELSRLRALLGEKDDENAYLSMRNDELATRLAEEEAAVARAMEEQSALESRLGEAEASMNQMMRAMAEAGQGSSMRINSIREGGSGGEGGMGGSKTAGSSAPPEEWTEEEGKEGGGKGKPTPLLFLSVGVDADAANSSSNSNVAPPMSPTLRQVYEEKLLSVERICTYLQDECDAQRETYEHMNRTLLNQNAQLALQKDGFVRQIFALEVKVQDLETALRSLRRGLSGSGAQEMDGGRRSGAGALGFLFRSTSSSLSQSTKSAVKTITGGRKAGSGGSSRQIVGGGEQEMQQT